MDLRPIFKILAQVKRLPIGKLMDRRVSTIRYGVAKGLKRRGGIGFIGLFKEESRETQYLKAIDFNGNTIFDIGCAFGAFTMFFASRTSGQVIAFEPLSRNCNAITENLNLNGLKNARVIRTGVGVAPAELEIVYDPVDTATASFEQEIKSNISLSRPTAIREVVPVDSIDNLILEHNLPSPDFVKIDVEGMEVEVLKGMSALFSRKKPFLYIEMHGMTAETKKKNLRESYSILTSSGYLCEHIESGKLIEESNLDWPLEGHLFCRPIGDR